MDHSYSPQHLEKSQIQGLPNSICYIPNFLTPTEESFYISKIESQPYRELKHRRLQVYPAPLTNDVLLASASIPRWLSDPIFPRFAQLGVFANSPHRQPNHVLVNQYQRGEGIMPHEDGPAYAPITATVSLGAPTVLELYERKPGGEKCDEPRWRILQEERSLLVTHGDAYKVLIHGISDLEIDCDLTADSICNWHLLGDPARFESGTLAREMRISLTCRDVARVSSLGQRLFGKR